MTLAGFVLPSIVSFSIVVQPSAFTIHHLADVVDIRKAEAPVTLSSLDASASFASYRSQHLRTYEPGSAEYVDRQGIFEKSIAWVKAHNSREGRTWTAGLTKLSDRTEQELAGLRGYRRQARSGRSSSEDDRNSRTFLSKTLPQLQRNISNSMPESWSWQNKLAVTREIMDQQDCGSCWAFASAATLRAHSELFQTDRQFSTQQIVSCVENPMKCGGDGGCMGATAELAMDYVKQAGCTTSDDFKYKAEDIECPAQMTMPHSKFGALLGGDGSGSMNDAQMGGRAFGMLDWKRLPVNQVEPLKQALVQQGPIASSVATYDQWNYYISGVLDTCADEGKPEENFIVNHAVMLIGYGTDNSIGSSSGMKYWQFQNSWGNDWGEQGFIRVKREADADEDNLCAWDESPELGTGCANGPSKVYVCGSCGVLYDNVVPVFEASDQGWWHNHGKKDVHADKPILVQEER